MGLEERAEERRQRAGTMHRLVKRENADRSFDYEFWQNLSAEERFAAMWQLVIDMRILRGEDEAEPRLRRHVQNIKFRREDLIEVKKAAGRPQDLRDAEDLEKTRKPGGE